ncbi:hypothetical protein [Pseudorhodoferax sp. Leaf265]|uniref:hypothetical protein n=1 Tax=Pseudorhodoferax sp. Leaf265 TaxID=1736315 RepID=UPI0006FAAFC0|nr:hypothetical protein [Pseudorhodoferax sp. Leaf265]KQP21334.1 hypothetical protein ASF45_03925 [Pseudorhodoferax sp. Leaf265]
MECYKLVDGALKRVDDPVEVGPAKDEGDFIDALVATGYSIRVCSTASGHASAEVTIYETAKPGLPKYYIDVMGEFQGIAVLVADDFPGLLATLRELAPLTTLIGLDQAVKIKAANAADAV